MNGKDQKVLEKSHNAHQFGKKWVNPPYVSTESPGGMCMAPTHCVGLACLGISEHCVKIPLHRYILCPDF